MWRHSSGVADTSKESRLQRRLARAEGACGCPEGAAAAVSTTSIYVAFVLWPSLQLGAGSAAMRAIGAVGVFLLSAALGKFAGIALANWRARQLRNQLAQVRST